MFGEIDQTATAGVNEPKTDNPCKADQATTAGVTRLISNRSGYAIYQRSSLPSKRSTKVAGVNKKQTTVAGITIEGVRRR